MYLYHNLWYIKFYILHESVCTPPRPVSPHVDAVHPISSGENARQSARIWDESLTMLLTEATQAKRGRLPRTLSGIEECPQCVALVRPSSEKFFLRVYSRDCG